MREHLRAIAISAAITTLVHGTPSELQATNSLAPPIDLPDDNSPSILVAQISENEAIDTPLPRPFINKEDYRLIPTPTPTELPWTNTARITSYCLQGRTRSGTPVRPGVVATDPSVIPLGSLIEIESLPLTYTAEDTGGGVRGWHIDVWDRDCNWSIQWGIRQRNVRVIRWGW